MINQDALKKHELAINAARHGVDSLVIRMYRDALNIQRMQDVIYVYKEAFKQ